VCEYSSSSGPSDNFKNLLERNERLQKDIASHNKFLTQIQVRDEKFETKWKSEDFGSPILNKAKDRASDLWERYNKTENYIDTHVERISLSFHSSSKFQESSKAVREKILDLETKRDEQLKNLNAEFKEERSIAYIEKAVSIFASTHKKIVKEKTKHEDLISSNIRNIPEVKANPDQFNEAENAWKERLGLQTKLGRELKQEIIKDVKVNLESPSLLASNLLDELGPDYTGGDD
jgi:hypothetical protein